MEITNIDTFLEYYERVRERTKKLIAAVPPEQLEWAYLPGKFTIGDVIRHIANIERYMYAETVQGRPSAYQGCDISYAEGYANTLAYFDTMHAESVAIFRSIGNEGLQRKCMTPAGIEIRTAKWLRAMTEHEIHHRGELYIYLNLLGVKTPPIFTLTAEEVAARSISPGNS